MSEAILDIWVPGRPVPQGSLSRNRQGKTYQKKELLDWRQLITHAATQYTGTYFGAWEPLDEAVRVDATFYMPRPKTVTRDLPTSSPDVDKLARGLLDALSPKVKRRTAPGAFLEDDSRVVDLRVDKQYAHDIENTDGNEPGVRIKVRKIE